MSTPGFANSRRAITRKTIWATVAVSTIVSFAFFGILAFAGNTAKLNWVAALVVAIALYMVLISTLSAIVEGRRKSIDRLITTLLYGSFALAMVPLLSLLVTTIVNGAKRFDLQFFSDSMRNVVDEGGGGLHAIIGTLEVTAAASVISIPIGIMTAIYLVEYGRGKLAKSITFLVDVMTGIPSIVAGLFAFALFSLILGPGIRFGLGGAVALSLLMIPVVVRSTEEMLKLVPNELREASYALGVPKWLTIVKVVLPTSIAGIITGVVISISRIIGETAPLLIICGLTDSMNYNLFMGRMTTLPVFVYSSYANQGTGTADIDRAWTGALVLILIVLVLNLVARILSKVLAPKGTR